LRPEILLVIDAAYGEFARAADYSMGHELVDRGENTVVVRTFSKFFAMAGLRLGWAHGPAPVVDVINRIRGPFNVALPTQMAAIAALGDGEFQARVKAHNDAWLPWTTEAIRALGLEVLPSEANFILVRFPAGPKNADAANAHLNAAGIIPRKVGAYGLPDCIRITIGTEAEMRAVRDSLAEFMG
jgi:histidinol-phosphate aminotransferase